MKKIIIVTGSGSHTYLTREYAMKSGAAGYIEKHFSEKDVVDEIHRVLRTPEYHCSSLQALTAHE